MITADRAVTTAAVRGLVHPGDFLRTLIVLNGAARRFGVPEETRKEFSSLSSELYSSYLRALDALDCGVSAP